MSTSGDVGLEVGPDGARNGHGLSIAVPPGDGVGDDHDSRPDIEMGVPCGREEESPSSSAQPQPQSRRPSSRMHPLISSTLSLRSRRAEVRAARPTVRECLSEVPAAEMADLTLDVYNMFFLSGVCSQAFAYSLSVLIIKMSLYGLLLADIAQNKRFPSQGQFESTVVVQITQFLLIPVSITSQEELITSFFIFSHLRCSPEITRRHPGALKWKYYVAHTARFADGVIFLFINTCVMLLEIKDVLQLFLNFAALMFLQTIDNIALEVCLNGYWTSGLQEAAQDVVDMKLAYRHNYVHKFMQMSFVVVAWGAMVGVWAMVHFTSDPDSREVG